MILAGINQDKLIQFKATNAKLIKNIQFVIEFPNDIVKRFNGTLNKDSNEIEIQLPSMKDFVTEAIEVPCFLEIEDIYGAFHKLSQDTIVFKLSPVIDLAFHEPENFGVVNKKEVFLDDIEPRKPEIKFKTNKKSTSRRNI